jgi:hypothetical protein
MMRANYCAAVVILVSLTMAGCCPYGELKKDYGNSYNAAKAGQILNPGASNNLAPVTGLPGAAADGAVKRYTETFAPANQQAPNGGTKSILPIGAMGMEHDAYGKK